MIINMKNKGNYTAGSVHVKIAAHVDDAAAKLQEQADYNKQCFEKMRDELVEAIIKQGEEIVDKIKAQQFKGPADE